MHFLGHLLRIFGLKRQQTFLGEEVRVLHLQQLRIQVHPLGGQQLIASHSADKLVDLLIGKQDVAHGEGADIFLMAVLPVKWHPFALHESHVAVLEVFHLDLAASSWATFERFLSLLDLFWEVDSEGDAGADGAQYLLDIIELILDFFVLSDALFRADVAETDHEEGGPNHVDVAVPDANRQESHVVPNFDVDHLVGHCDQQGDELVGVGQTCDHAKDALEQEHVHVGVAVLGALHGGGEVFSRDVGNQEGSRDEVVNRVPQG